MASEASDFSLIGAAISAQLEAEVPYLRGKGATVAVAADVQAFFDAPAPAYLLEGPRFSPSPGTGRIGLPIAQDFDLVWSLFLMATSFGPRGEGRFSSLPRGAAAARSAGPGAGQMVRDASNALSGFLADPENGYSGARLKLLPPSLEAVLDGKLVWAARFRQSVRWLGQIAS